MRKTKIVGTLGPASSESQVIGALLDAGMSAVRLNFSHGKHEEHAANIRRVREQAGRRDRLIPIIADLQGPKIRTGKLKGGEPVSLKAGGTLRLSHQPIAGDEQSVSIDYPTLAEDVEVGDRILLDDGAIALRVSRIESGDVVCEILNDGLLRERKGVNVPGAALKLPSVTEKDKADLRFALDQGVDYIALSFVRRASDVELLKNLIASAKTDTHVIAKLEKPQALDDLTRILEVSDGVMVARGDLGVELSPWQVPVEQKRIIREAAGMRKPVITATQMLESMIERPSPTRAESSDVANAVLDGSDALMLSGETAVGRYPVEAVTMMGRIIESAEAMLPERAFSTTSKSGRGEDLSDAVARSAAELAEQMEANYIVVFTESGYTARLVSKHRPRPTILGLSRHHQVCRRMKLLWGVRAKLVDEIRDVDHLVRVAESLLLRLGWSDPGDLICIVAGTPFRVSGKTDLIKLHRIGEAASGPHFSPADGRTSES